MIDLRIWRTALLAAPVALVVAMFSLQQPPEPLESAIAPDAFDGTAAANLARDMASQFPEPTPGSDSDEAMAQFVQDRFTAIPSAQVAEQSFEASYDGEDRELRNLILTLPGRSERQIALIAGRDVADGSGAATSVAATAIMLQIAEGFSGTSHEKSLVFVSTSGGAGGAAGARTFLRDYTQSSLLDAAIVVSQPAAEERRPPFSIPWSTGAQDTSAALAETANATLSDEAGEPAGDPGPVSELMRLAIPSGIGEQGPLVEAGLDAVRVSSAGELPVPPAEDTSEQVNGQSISDFGRGSLSLLLALDAARTPLEHGPPAYIALAGNLLPGWALAMLALALLAPVAVVAAIGIAGAASSPWTAARAVGWAAFRSVPFLLSLATVLVLAFAGVIPGPDFPFDPASEALGTKGTIGVVVAFLVLAAGAFLLRPLLAPPPALAEAAPAAALVLSVAAGLLLWLSNPYLCLLFALGLQAWVPAAAGAGRGRLGTAALVALGFVPVLLAVADLATRFDAGPAVAWDLLMMFTGGQIPDSQAFLWCVLGGCGLALVAAAGEPRGDGEGQLDLGALVERGRRLEQRRAAGKQKRSKRARRDAEREERRERLRREAEEAVPPPDAVPGEGDQPPESGEGGADPRMWSKPPASTSPPWPSRIATPSPSLTRPI